MMMVMSLTGKAHQQIEHFIDLRTGKAGHRLVGNQQFRLRRHRARKLHLAQFHLAELVVERIGLRRQAHVRQDRHHGVAPLRDRDMFMRGKVERDHEILGNRHAPERPRNLKTSRNAPARAHMRLQRRDVLVAEQDSARLGAERAGNAVDQRGLARAVRTDQAEPLPRTNVDADIVDRGEAAEAFGQRNDPQQRRRSFGSHHAPPSLR